MGRARGGGADGGGGEGMVEVLRNGA
jgi:hypothetical protein